MKKKIKDLVFSCQKCGHLLFITGSIEEKINKIASLNKCECDNCGEEGFENWIYIRIGNYEKEFGREK